MDQIKNCYEQLHNMNGKFKGNLIYNFDNPSVFNEPPYHDALLGNLSINTRNSIGKFQGDFLIYEDNNTNLIRLKEYSKDKSCKLAIELTEEENSKITNKQDALIIQFDTFLELLNDDRFYLS